ncbi:MAG TPA: EamA family transporter [Chitinophagaceae bacterium]|nr:EamA family transporter [Chitinophagaceae bacterium]
MSAHIQKLAGSSLNPLGLGRRGTRFKAIFALSLVAFFWGTTWLASREGVKYMPPLQLAAIRQFLAGLIYLVYFMTKGRVFPKGKEWRPILILSLLNFVLSNGLATWGVKYISGGLAAIIGAIFPLWLVVIGFFRSQKLPLSSVIGIFLGFGGICIIFYEHLPDFLNRDFSFGILISIAATWSWAFGTLYTKDKARDFNPYVSIGLQMLIAGIFLYLASAVSHEAIPLRSIPVKSWLAIAYLVIFGSVISFVAYLYALQHLPIAYVSTYAYINPVVAVLLGGLFFGERFTMFIAAGGAVTLYGTYLVNQAFRKSREKTIVSDEQGSHPAS